jgi:hypothetical protein
MICSTSFLNKIGLVLVLAVVFQAGCALILEEKQPLTVEIRSIEIVGPEVARTGAVRLSAEAKGGEGKVSYAFHSVKDGLEAVEQSGEDPDWTWLPKEPGTYRLKVTVTDEAGEVTDSGWSKEYTFGAPVGIASLYAVFPVDNLSGERAPLKEIQAALAEALSAKGFNLLDQGVLEEFMKKNRIRYTGGVSADISKKLQDELGVDGIFITSLETWQDAVPPRISLITRVVLSGNTPEIVWMDSVGLTGNDEPGLLGIGRVREPERLLANALERLMGSFQLYLAGRFPTYRSSSGQEPRPVNSESRTADATGPGIKGFHRPQFTYRAADFQAAGQYVVAVIPFLNVDARKNAGQVVALHFVKELQRYENLRVVEPGLVRQVLLNYRMIMEAGPSLAASDTLANEAILGADLVLSGKVFDYQGKVGRSKVDFSVQAFDGKRRMIVWTSRSYATGDEGVYFFGLGTVHSAHGLTSRMAKAVAGLLME